MGIYIDIKKVGKISFIVLITFVLFGDLLNSLLRVPDAMSRYVVYYMSYILTVCIILQMVSKNRNNSITINLPRWQIPMFAFLTYVIFSAVLCADMNAVFYNFRMYLVGYSVFSGSLLFIDRETVGKWIYKVLYYLSIIHCLLTAVEYIMFREPDMCGGIFGITYGRSNRLSHSFILLSTLVFFCAFLIQKIKPMIFYLFIAISALSAAFAEIKIFYFELVALLFVYFIMSKKFIRSLFTILFIGGIIYVGVILTVKYNPDFVNFFSKVGIEKYLSSGYGGKLYAVSRTNGYKFIYEVIFEKSLLKTIFGIGFTGKYQALVSLFNVDYFAYSTIFFYGGIIGSLLYYIIPVYFCFMCFRKERDEYVLLSSLTGIAIVFTSFYSSECLTPASSAMYYFMLSLGAQEIFISSEKMGA